MSIDLDVETQRLIDAQAEGPLHSPVEEPRLGQSSPGTDETGMIFRRSLPESRCQPRLSPGSRSPTG
jgi:hypothetical protein